MSITVASGGRWTTSCRSSYLRFRVRSAQNAGMNSMRPPWTIRRIIWGVVSLGLLGFGVRCFVDGHRRGKDVERWQTAKPVDGEVDFSAPGHFSLSFEQTCSSSHGETVALRVPPEVLQSTSVTQLLAGLDARLEITDLSPATNVVASAEASAMWGDQMLDGAIPLFHVFPFRKGAYRATVTVTEGAPALRGIHQRLEGRYLLCGMEALPALFATILGDASAGSGAIVATVVACLVRRDRRRQRNGHTGAAPSEGVVKERVTARHDDAPES